MAAARGQRVLANEVVVHLRLDVDHGFRGEELHDGLHGRGQPGGALLGGASPDAGEIIFIISSQHCVTPSMANTIL